MDNIEDQTEGAQDHNSVAEMLGLDENGPDSSAVKYDYVRMLKHPSVSIEVMNGVTAFIESGPYTPSKISNMVGRLLQYYSYARDVVLDISRQELIEAVDPNIISLPHMIHSEFKEWLLTLDISRMNLVVENLDSKSRNAQIFTYYYWVYILGISKEFRSIARNVKINIVDTPIAESRVEKSGLFDRGTQLRKEIKVVEGYNHLMKDEMVSIALEYGGEKMKEYYNCIIELLSSGERFKVSQELYNRIKVGKKPRPDIAIPRNLEDILLNKLKLKSNGEFDAFMLLFWTVAPLLGNNEFEVFQEPAPGKAREYSHRYVSKMRWKDEEMLGMRAAIILKELFEEQ